MSRALRAKWYRKVQVSHLQPGAIALGTVTAEDAFSRMSKIRPQTHENQPEDTLNKSLMVSMIQVIASLYL